MRKIIVGAMVSMDGVMQAPGGVYCMRKPLAINYVAQDGVMQSPGAFQ
jgi:hypothetical protein